MPSGVDLPSKMAASSENEFDSWLSEKLKSLSPDIDLEVFVTYIRGILEEESSDEEKAESIEGFLAEITEEDLSSYIAEIINKWISLDGAIAAASTTAAIAGQSTLDQKIAGIMEVQKNTVVKPKSVSEEDKRRKEAILKQYGHVSEGEDDDEPDPAVGGATSKTAFTATYRGTAGGAAPTIDDALLVKNMNSLMVTEREKAQRDADKQDAAKKKEKDKLDREKQKQKAQERKEAEKKRTQKGERKR